MYPPFSPREKAGDEGGEAAPGEGPGMREAKPSREALG